MIKWKVTYTTTEKGGGTRIIHVVTTNRHELNRVLTLRRINPQTDIIAIETVGTEF